MKVYLVTVSRFESYDGDEWGYQAIYLGKESALARFLKEVDEARKEYGNTMDEEQSDTYCYIWYGNSNTVCVEMTETETED